MNNLDKLFSEKLKKHEISPSQRANELFLSRLEQKKKVVFWTGGRKYFAAAASVMIMSSVGYLMFQNEDTGVSNVAAVSPQSSTVVTETPKAKSNINTQKTTQTAYKVQVNEDFAAKGTNINLPVNEKIASFGQDDSPEFIIETPAVARLERPNTKPLEAALEPLEDVVKTQDDTFIIISDLAQTETALNLDDFPSIMDQPSLDNALEQEYHGEKVLTKVVDDLKNLKKGQNLDFSKYGFKSLEELALQDEGFILTEARKIKNTVQWIKSKLNN
jgi:hypothetical protein